MMPLLTDKDLFIIIGASFATFVFVPVLIVSSIVRHPKNVTYLDKIVFGCKVFYLLATWSYWGSKCLPFLLSLDGTVALVLAVFLTVFHIGLACVLLYHFIQFNED